MLFALVGPEKSHHYCLSWF